MVDALCHFLNLSYYKLIHFLFQAKRLHEEPLTISNPVLVEGPGYDHTRSIDHIKSINNQRKLSADDSFFSRSSSFSLKSLSRRSKTPNPRRSSMSKSTSKRSITPTLSRNMSQKSPSGTETFVGDRNMSIKATASDQNSTTSPLNPSLSRNMSKRSTTPIFFSQSTARRKPSPVERKLGCTLEELLQGSVRKIKVTRDVITDTGFVIFLYIIVVEKLILVCFHGLENCFFSFRSIHIC